MHRGLPEGSVVSASSKEEEIRNGGMYEKNNKK